MEPIGVTSTPVICRCKTDEEQSFCYVEATKSDKSSAKMANKLTKNVWHFLKPPHFTTANPPTVSARQLQVARGKLMCQKDTALHGKPKENLPQKTVVVPSKNKKKSAAKFFSRTFLE